jgi:hypothetical protein
MFLDIDIMLSNIIFVTSYYEYGRNDLFYISFDLLIGCRIWSRTCLTVRSIVRSFPVFICSSCWSMFSVMICRSSFLLYRLTIALSIRLRRTSSDYPFDNFKFFLPMGAMFVNGSDDISYLHRCFLQNFDLFGQAVLEKIFRNRPTRNKNCLLQPGLMDPTKWAIFIENLPNKFPFIWPSSFRADF